MASDAPKVPAPTPQDPEDVSWALSTAEAMFARGDMQEAIKWIRKAAEAASEVEADERALELAKAAADLSALSGPKTAPMNLLTKTLLTPATALPLSVRNAQAEAFRAQQARYEAPAAKTEPPPPSMPLQRVNTKRDVPLPSRGRAPRPPSVPAPAMPLSTRGGVLAPRKRRSQANLDDAARRAAALGEAPPTTGTPGTMRAASGPSSEEPSVPTVPTLDMRGPTSRGAGTPEVRKRRKSHTDRVETSRRAPQISSTDEWDASPTQNLTGEELARMTDEGRGPPISAPVPTPLVQLPAIRVILWRDSEGIHVAPAGSAAAPGAVDGLVVALDPACDLAAWLEEERGQKPKRSRQP